MKNQNRKTNHISTGLLLACSLLMLWKGCDVDAAVSAPVVTVDIPASEQVAKASVGASVKGSIEAVVEDKVAMRDDVRFEHSSVPSTRLVRSRGREKNGDNLTVIGAAEAPLPQTHTLEELRTMRVSPNDYAIVEELACNYEAVESDTIYDAFTPDEIRYLQQMVETETFCAPFMSKVYTAEVALARYRRYYGTTPLTAIITSPCQFAYWRTGISQDTVWAVEFAYKYSTEAQNALFFQRGYLPAWYGYKHLFTCAAGHNFYGMTPDEELVPTLQPEQ